MCQQQICPSKAIYRHICQLLHMYICNNYISIYTSYELNAINNVTKSTCIHTFHITDMPLNKYSCHIAHTCPTALLLQSTYRPHITTHIHHRSIPCNNLPYYWKIYTISKYAPQMPYKWHMPKLHTEYLWGKYANIYATYEAAHVNRITVHQWWWWWHQCRMMMMPQSAYTHWAGQLAKSVKRPSNCNF